MIEPKENLHLSGAPQRWDIFCTVIDNFGDIGVCWRLARQLAGEHGLQVRLWVGDVARLQPLHPDIDPAQENQTARGVEIRRWEQDFPLVEPAEVLNDTSGGHR